MHFEMKMPDLATNESPIRIVRWLVGLGQKVNRGQPLMEVETDKATMEVEAVVAGVLQEARCRENEEVSVGHVIAILEVGETAQEITPFKSVSHPLAESSAPASTLAAGQPPPAAGKPPGLFARNRARAATPPGKENNIPLSLAQRVAARRLQESKQTVPHFYLQTSADASAMMARRRAAGPHKLAWDAFFVRAVARALGRFERFRCRFEGERLVPVASDAIGVAVDREGELFVLPIATPAGKTLEQISDEIRLLVDRLQRGDPEARRLHPTLMTVTNLGVCNIESFIPIINPPETAILGVGRIRLTPVVQDNGQVGIQPRCILTLSVDHRVASGKYAGQFLEEIVRELETL
jgi:pyruvate dehydrogenase E2 component (dihydrolipoamide acetyltransferase)